MRRTIAPLSLALFLSACTTNYENLPAYSDNKQLQAVIEIPAGSAHKYKYDPETHTFPVDQKAGREQIVDFLPYPGNYGFIPSTRLAKNRGGDGDGLDILVIGESRETGTVMEVLPLGIILLEVAGELDYKVI